MLPACARAHAERVAKSVAGFCRRTAQSGAVPRANSRRAERGLAVRHILLPLLAATLPLVPLALHAQVTTATLYGVVRDATAGALPGALITVLNQGTAQSREIVTDPTGEFALTALPTGRYLEDRASGFKDLHQRRTRSGAGRRAADALRWKSGSWRKASPSRNARHLSKPPPRPRRNRFWPRKSRASRSPDATSRAC